MLQLAKNLILAVFLVISVTSPVLAETISAPDLEAAVRTHRNDVPEFKFIAEYAKRNGLRVWLFGGTAASFAHYAKWDLQRQGGDRRFQPNRFDYDYTNIYRSNQDLDIVIDGDARRASELQQLLAKKFPHLMGQKSVWEVRLLTENLGDKEALLRNPDFSNQHTDSHSVGMIELTDSSEPVIRDLRDWSNARPAFLEDVLAAKLHYYFSPLHKTTARFKDGKNPPILSVVRYFIKAFQFELAMDPADVSQLESMVRAFNPAKLTEYELSWLVKNAPKLIQNAVDIEYAWNTLESFGLREKLAAIGDKSREGTVAFWMNKEPLRSKKVGQGSGKTARELGIAVVAHETKSFEAYESITRAHTGEPNVLISRDGVTGEAAYHGNGFYTMTGREGARGTDITIRFTVDPNARESTDFMRANHPGMIIFLNKNALKVIPESLNFGFKEYVGFLRSNSIDQSERAALEKLKRRLNARMVSEVTAADLAWFDHVVLESVTAKETKSNVPLLKFWIETRRPFEVGFDRALLMKILAGANRKGSFLPVLRNLEISKPFDVSLQEYLDLYPRYEVSESGDVRLLTALFRPPTPSTVADLEAIAKRIRQEERTHEELSELWLRAALVMDSPFDGFIATLGRPGVIESFKSMFDGKNIPEVTRRLSFSEYIQVIRLWPWHSFETDLFSVRQRLKRRFAVPEPTEADLRALEAKATSKNFNQAVFAEWLDAVSPLHPEVQRLAVNDTYRQAVGHWLIEVGGRKFPITALRALDFLKTQWNYRDDSASRMALSLPESDRFEIRRILFSDLDLNHQQLNLIGQYIDKLGLSPDEQRDFSIRVLTTKTSPDKAYRMRALYVGLAKGSPLTTISLNEYRAIVKAQLGVSDRTVLTEQELAAFESNVRPTEKELRFLNQEIQTERKSTYLAHAEFRIWLRHQNVSSLESQASTLFKVFDLKTGTVHYVDFMKHLGNKPPKWLIERPEFVSYIARGDYNVSLTLLGTELKKIFIERPELLERLVREASPSLLSPLLYNFFTKEVISKHFDIYLIAVDRFYRTLPAKYEWRYDYERHLSDADKDPRVVELLKENPLWKRKVRLENLAIAIATRRTRLAAKQQPLLIRTFGERTCKSVFL